MRYQETALFIALIFTGGAVGPSGCMGTRVDESTTIKKIYFLIHPLVYVGHSELKAYYEYEKVVEHRWYEAIAGIGPDEALIIDQMVKSKRSDDLVQYA